MSETIQPELVVSSWPFRLGTIIYDPLLRIDVASWDLEDLAEHPDMLRVATPLLNPLLPYRKRSTALTRELAKDQDLLRAVYQVETGQDVTVQPQLSDDVERELGAWLRDRGLALNDIALRVLPAFLDRLADWPADRHHAFCADWWETFEQPSAAPKPSTFRLMAGPGGSLYRRAYQGDAAVRAWRADAEETAFGGFSLWHALRVHWAWRLEFPDQPKPSFPVLDRLKDLFRRTP